MNNFSSFSFFILQTLKVSRYQCYNKTKINIMMKLRALEKKRNYVGSEHRLLRGEFAAANKRVQ